MMDAKENRDVATADVVGVFLLADINEYMLIKITGDAVKMMCDANKEYRKYVTHEKGKPVLFMTLLKRYTDVCSQHSYGTEPYQQN